MCRTAFTLGFCFFLVAAVGCSDEEDNGGQDAAADAAQPDGAQPDGAQPDGAQPDGAQTDVAQTDAAAAPTCDDYCAAVMGACTAGNAQYASMADCVAVCAGSGWDAGQADATSGNTIGCRTTHATLASSDPAVHCSHAGQSGGNICGTWCEVYCGTSAAACTGNDAHTFAPDCATACGALPTSGGAGDASGDTVQCRIQHMLLAVTDAGGAAAHCPHAAPTPTAPCVDVE